MYTRIRLFILPGILFLLSFILSSNLSAQNAPTLDPIAVISLSESASPVERTVNLTGINDNDGYTQTIEITASSDNTGLIPDPTVSYTSPNTTGSIAFTPIANSYGQATITVTITDPDGTTNQTFVVSVNGAPTAVTDSYSTDEDTQLSVSAPGVLGNDSDPESNALTATLVTDVANGTLNLSADGSFIYTPDADFNGSVLFTYYANDGDLSSETVTVYITVNAINDAPVAVIDTLYSTDEDVQLVIDAASGVLANDTDIDTDHSSLTVSSIISDVTDGTLFWNSDGSFTYTPNLNFNGSDSFTYQAYDGSLISNTTTVTIKIIPVDDPPVAADDSGSVTEGGSVTINVISNDDDIDGTLINSTIAFTSEVNGNAVNNGDGTVTFTHDGSETTGASFKYTINDDGGATSNVATVSISVTPQNDAPVAVDDAGTVDEGGSVTIDVADNDSDVDGTIVLNSVNPSIPANGTAVSNGDGTVTYTHNGSESTSDSFTYTINDNDGVPSSPATVAITVNPVNDTPISVDDAYTTNEDTQLGVVAPGVLSNDTDPESNTISAQLVSTTTHGTLVLQSNGSFTYDPAADYYGSDSFTYSVSDVAIGDTSTVTITINPINDPPVFTSLDTITVDENVTSTLTVTTTDTENNTVTYSLPATGDNSLFVIDGGTGVLTFADPPDYENPSDADLQNDYVVTVDAVDNGTPAQTSSQVITITVDNVNEIPAAVNDSYETDEDTELSVNAATGVLLNDTDEEGVSLTAVIQAPTDHGSLTLNTNGSFTYTPDLNYTGSDFFTYTARDGVNISNIATVNISIGAVNDPPVAVADSYTVNEDETLTADNTTYNGLLFNDTDPDLNALTAILQTGVSHGTLYLSTDGTFTYTPNADFNGSDSFTYIANDGFLDSSPATVTITVTAVNDQPSALDDTYSTDEDIQLIIGVATGVLANDTDTDTENSTLTATLATDVLNGILSLSSDGSFTYTPNANFNGSDSFKYTANDGSLTSSEATVTITVNAINDPPSFTPVSPVSFDENQTGTVIDVDATDPELNTIAYSLDTNVDDNNAFSINSTTGELSFTSTPDFEAPTDSDPDNIYIVSVTATDNGTPVESSTQTITITVNNVNEAPVAGDDNYTTDEDVVLTTTPATGILANDPDPEGDAVTITVTNNVSNGILNLSPDGSFNYTPTENFYGTDIFTYTISDGTFDSNEATVTITVTEVNDPPAITSGNSVTVDENETSVITVITSDPEGNDITFSISGGDDGALFGINATTGELSFLSAPDYENPGDTGLDNIYLVNVTATDNGTPNQAVSQSITVTVNDINEGAPVFSSPTVLSVDENQTTTLTIIAVDPENNTVTYSLPVATNDNDLFSVDAASGVLTFSPAPDYESPSDANGDNNYIVTVIASDNQTQPLTSTQTITITVNDVNEGAPIFSSAANISVEENQTATLTVLATDPESNTVTYSLPDDITTDNALFSIDTSTGELSFISAPDFESAGDINGDNNYVVTVNASDNQVQPLVSSQSITITVTGINEPPVVISDTYSVNEDTQLSIAAPGVLGNDSDPESTALTIYSNTDVSNGTLVLANDGSFTYTPNSNFNGSDSFTYTATDGPLSSTATTVRIDVTPVNDAPNFTSGNLASFNENQTGTVIDVNASDPEDDNITFSLPSGTGDNNLFLISATGEITFNSSPDFENPQDQNRDNNYIVTVTATDDATPTASSSQIITITVINVNEAPSFTSSNIVSIEENQIDALTVTTFDPETNAVTYSLPSTGDNSLFNVDVNSGTISFRIAPDFESASDANNDNIYIVTVDATDDGFPAQTVSQTINITVTNVDEIPTAVNDSYETTEDTQLTVVAADGVLDNDEDEEGSTLTATVQATTTHGTLVLSDDGSFTYNPYANYNGPDQFTYSASDGLNTSNVATVNILVGPINDPPVANDDTYTINEDIVLIVDENSDLLGNDTDPDGNALTATLQSGVSYGTLVFSSDGTFTYTPDENFYGSDSFTYLSSDGFIDSNIATVTINVTSVNDPPVAVDDSGIVNEGEAVTINLTDNDSDVDGTLDLLSVSIINVTNGSYIYNGDGTILFTHDGSETTSAGFSYTIDDNQGAISNQATVTITVTPVNDLPVAADDNAVVNEGGSVDINILSNDSDEDGTPDPASVTIFNVAHGIYVDNGNGIITFTHDGSETISAGFSYTVDDDLGDTSNEAIVTISVNSVNDAPVFTSSAVTTIEENQTNVIAVETTDAENNDVTYSLPASDDNSLFAINSSTGVLTFISAPDYENPTDNNHDNNYIVTVLATDNGTPLQQSTTQTITISVSNINESPVVVDDSYTIFEDEPLVTNLTDGILSNDSDPDSDVLIITVQNNVSHGTLLMNADGTFTYTPASNYSGSDSFSYTVNDGTVNSFIANVTIGITAVNDAPLAVDDNYSTDEDAPLSVNVAGGLLINDSDPDNTGLTVSIQNNVSSGELTLSTDGSFLYVPNANFNGTDSFTYTISDGVASSNVATVNITVNSVNDIPVVQDNSYTTNEDIALTVNETAGVLNNDSDIDNDILTAVVQDNPSHGAVTLNSNGSFTYTPALDYNGSDSFTYTANDGTALSTIATVSITVTSQNDNPVASDDSGTVNEGGSTTINIVANDNDVDGSLIYSTISISNVTNGSIVDNGNGTITFTHDGSETTSAGFTYTINDDQGAVSNVANVIISVVQSNDIPVANNDSGAVNEGETVIIDIADNDTDPDGTLNYSSIIFSNVINGSCTNNNNGTISFTHDGSETITASFSYTINDDLGATSNIANVSITVTPQNDAPTANDDTGTVNEGESTTINIIANDTDPDGTLNLNSIFIGNVVNGITIDNGDGTVTFTHNGSETTTGGFSYTISDDQGATSSQATVAITVIPRNDAPVFTSSQVSTINENQSDVLTVTTTDAENNAITYSLSTIDDNALFIINSVTGELSFISPPDFESPADADLNNIYIVTVTATDNGSTAQSSNQQITVTVLDMNETPVAIDDAFNTNEDETLHVIVPGVLTNDTDDENGALMAYLQDNVTHGNLTFSTDGSFNYVPELNYNGDDQFSYYVSDGNTNSSVAVVSLNIHPQNDAPVASDDSYNTSEDRTLIVNSPGVLANDIDIDGNSLTATLVSSTSNGTLTLNSDGSFSYQPNLNFAGSDSFTYAANDGSLLSNTVTVTINVGETNDAPVSENDTYSMNEDETLTVDLPGILTNDTDPDNNSLSAVLVNSVTHGTLTLNTNGSFTYTPANDYNGNDIFTYQASDGQTTGNTATVTITILPVNDAPVAQNDNLYTAENTPDNINVTLNDSDPDDSPMGGVNENSVTIVTQPKHGTAIPVGNKINYTPHTGYYGNDTLTYSVFDTGYPLPALNDTALVYIKVARRSPLAINDSVSISEDNAIDINILANDQDIDINPSTVTIGTPPSHGEAVVNTSTGVITYTPATNYFGADGFTYTVKDLTDLTSNIANVIIDVIAVPDPPVTVDGNFSTPEDVDLTVQINEVASDPDNDIDYTSVEFISTPANGSVSSNSSTGEMTYTPDNGFSGVDVFTFRISDLRGTVSNTSSISITVSNEAPNAQNDSYTITEDQVSDFTVLLNDTDPQNNILTDSVRITTDPLHGTTTVNGSTGVVTYTPEKDYFGSDNFTYKVTDATNYSDQAQVTIDITPLNDPPVAVNDSVTFKEDQKSENFIDILNNDFDIDNLLDSTSVTIFRAPIHGQVNFDATTHLISYSPEVNFFGNDSLIYEVSDMSGATSQGSVFITILPVADSPQPQDDYISTNEESEVTFNVLLNDVDVENDIDSCSIVISTMPEHGMVTVLSDPDCGKIKYTPGSNYLGTDQFVYLVSDTSGLTGLATVYITINNTPDAPIANDDNYSTPEDSILIMNVLLNDTDPDNDIDSAKLSIVEPPQHGTLEVISNRIRYIPVTNYYGADQFRYQTCDSTNLCDTAYVYLNVTPVNDAPVAVDDYDITVNQVNIRTNVAANDTDPDDNLDLYSIIVVTQPSHGSVEVENGTGYIIYTPTPDVDYYGPDKYDYRICDTNGACDTATVFLEITSGNVAPVTQPDYVVTNEDTPVNISPAQNDSDPNDNLNLSSVTIVKPPVNGTATLDTGTGQINYEPSFNFNGNDTIVYSICDDEGLCSTDNIFITIQQVNDAPDAVIREVETSDNSIIDIDVLSFCTDPENDLLTVSISEYTPVIDGIATVNEDGTIRYESAQGVYCKSEQVIYKVCDAGGLCDTASIFVTILPTDSDGDNIPDFLEKDGDSDNDNIPNYLDDDSDGDGISDFIEGAIDNPCSDVLPDTDGDSIYDYLDTDSDDDGVPDSEEGYEDCDDDGIPNYRDVEDDCVERLDVPDTFSPNGDGINDFFKIPGANELTGDKLYVYNRWGGLVYESDNYDNTWDGRSLSGLMGSDELQEGTYFYIYKPDETMQVFKGTVYLKR